MGVAVDVAVGVAVDVAVGVGVGLGVKVAVRVGVGVAVDVTVAVLVGAAVEDDICVNVGSTGALPHPISSNATSVKLDACHNTLFSRPLLILFSWQPRLASAITSNFSLDACQDPILQICQDPHYRELDSSHLIKNPLALSLLLE